MGYFDAIRESVSSLFGEEFLSGQAVENGLNWAYDQTLRQDMPWGMCNALELADEYRQRSSSLTEASSRLIKDEVLKIGGIGFISSLGGLVSLPGLPLNIGISWAMQLRIVNALAYLGGRDLESEDVRSLSLVLLLGEKAKMFLRQGITSEGIRVVMKKLVPQLAAKVSGKGLGRMVPIVSGVVGASMDLWMAYSVARIAQQTFLGLEIEQESLCRMEEERIKLLVNMGRCDGSWDDRERSLIADIIEDSGLSEGKKEEYIQSLVRNALPYHIDFSLFRQEEGCAENLLAGLLAVAQADGVIHPSEKVYLMKIAGELNLSSAEILSITDSLT